MEDLKQTAGKPRVFVWATGFATALRAVVAVNDYGFHKYVLPRRNRLVQEGATVEEAVEQAPDHNWQFGRRDDYLDAAMRHLLARAEGEVRDRESGLPHLAHAAWSLLAALTFDIMEFGS